MQQFKALLKKELNGYFKSYFVYVIFAIYLFVSAGSSCYFGSYLATKDTTMFSLFYLQPLILLIIVPAITMKSWAEEYKSGTAEFLLTQPVTDWNLVSAKVFAAFLICSALSLCLLPQIIYTGTWLHLDVSNIICCFIGLWLLQFYFCSLGCLISSFSRYMIVVYLISVFVMVLLLITKGLAVYTTFDNFLYGEIGIGDICYFIFFGAAFMWLNTQILLYKRNVWKTKTLKLSFFTILLLMGVGLSVVIINLIFTVKFDFTSAGAYTPTNQSAQIVAGLKEPYTFDIYISKDYKNHNSEYYQYYGQVKRFLKKYQNLSEGMLTVRTIEVEPYSELENIILRNGLYYEENDRGSFNYFGAFLRNANGDGVVLKHFITERRPFLEKDIDQALLKVSKPQFVKTLGVYMDSTQNLEEYQGLMQNIENDFNTINVTAQTYEISNLLDMLILINPKQLPPYFIYAIDQYLVNGGKVVLFFDMMTENQSEVTNLEMVQISKLFSHWGILLNNKFTDSVALDANFKTLKNNVQVKDAVSFSMKNTPMDIQPILTDGDKYIGVLLSGSMASAYDANPFEKQEALNDMGEHTSMSLAISKLAIIGDVDFIEDYLWTDARSFSKNPYSVIAKNDNIAVVRQLIEDMLDIKEYKELPMHPDMENIESIGQQINSYVYNQYMQQYLDTMEELQDTKQVLIDKSAGNQDKLAVLLQISEAGQKIADLEKEVNRLVYAMKRSYSIRVNKVLFYNIILFPCITIGLLLLIFILLTRWQNKNIRKFLNE